MILLLEITALKEMWCAKYGNYPATTFCKTSSEANNRNLTGF